MVVISFASHAILKGIPAPAISHILGRGWPSMALRHAHVGEREIVKAAERVGGAIARALDGS